MAATITAVKLGCRVAHVEAGLRSFDRTMPEEINRLVTDALADLLLTPSPDADENLRREGVPESRICRVGNIMIDALVDNLPKSRNNPIGKELGVEPRRFIYVTLHRPSNVDKEERIRRIMDLLGRLSEKLPVVLPIHPRTGNRLDQFGIAPSVNGRFHLVKPVGYHSSLWLSENARLVITDSGGLQEETTYFHTPCLTLRANTERPITITQGSNKLTTPESLLADSQAIFQQRNERNATRPDLWDGRTAERIIDILADSN
jgi:UDP-N-acetylglucosamine 2-epimerase (non-hydrolysing)